MRNANIRGRRIVKINIRFRIPNTFENEYRIMNNEYTNTKLNTYMLKSKLFQQKRIWNLKQSLTCWYEHKYQKLNCHPYKKHMIRIPSVFSTWLQASGEWNNKNLTKYSLFVIRLFANNWRFVFVHEFSFGKNREYSCIRVFVPGPTSFVSVFINTGQLSSKSIKVN